jgi:hypothetical protein
MAQGKLKGMQTSKQKAARPASSSSKTKKGKRYIAPKKPDAIKLASLKRVRTDLNLSFFFLHPFLHLLGERNIEIGSECASYIGPRRKDQSLDRETHRQRCLIREAHDHEKRWV